MMEKNNNNNVDSNNSVYWKTKAEDFARVIDIINKNESQYKTKNILDAGIHEILLFLYGIQLELLLKALFLRKGGTLYKKEENGAFKCQFPNGIKSGHELAKWIDTLNLRSTLDNDIIGGWEDTINTTQDFLIDYGKYPFSKKINQQGYILYSEDDLEILKEIIETIKTRLENEPSCNSPS